MGLVLEMIFLCHLGYRSKAYKDEEILRYLESIVFGYTTLIS